MGIPASTDYMLRFVDTVRRDIRPDMIGPIVVHCRYFFESLFYCLFLNAHFFVIEFDSCVYCLTPYNFSVLSWREEITCQRDNDDDNRA